MKSSRPSLLYYSSPSSRQKDRLSQWEDLARIFPVKSIEQARQVLDNEEISLLIASGPPEKANNFLCSIDSEFKNPVKYYLPDNLERPPLEDWKTLPPHTSLEALEVVFEGAVEIFHLRQKVHRELQLARQIAEDASRAKSEFLANVSHEIRTPLNTIMGMNHLLQQTEITSTQESYLRKMDEGVDNLLKFINAILDFSKIESRRLDLAEIDFNLEALFRELSNLVMSQFCQKDLEITFQIKTDVPIFLRGDPLRIKQVLTNLITNAIKFTEKGKISVTAELVKEKKKKVELKFTVADSGIGISEEEKKNLFQPFTQADTSATRKYGGAGLGLAISKKLVSLMGGEIWVKSTPQKGSEFSFTILVERLAEAQLEFSPSRNLRDLEILIIDDDPHSREIIEAYLDSFSFSSRAVSSGEEGLRELRENPQKYDLLLVDWNLPEESGLQVIGKIREMMGDSAPLVLVLSAWSREEVLGEAGDVHIHGFIEKPVTPSAIFEKIIEAFTLNNSSLAGESTLAILDGGEKLDLSVLLVEDNELNRDMASRVLQARGIEVSLARNGKEAIELIEREDFDCVLMDVQMPLMDGYETTKIIRSDLEKKDLPIIAMTANAMKEDREKCLAVGMNDYLSKPINFESLFLALTRNTKHSRKKVSLPSSLPRSLPGLNLKAGLVRLQGDERCYLELIDKFSRRYRDFDQTLKEEVKKENRQEALREIRGLRGVAGNLGASDLEKEAAKVEKQLMEKEEINREELSFQLQKAIQSMEEISLPQEGSLSLREAKPGLVLQKLETLEEMLLESDGESPEFADKIARHSLPLSEEENFKDLFELVHRYQFEKALSKLSEIKTNLTNQIGRRKNK